LRQITGELRTTEEEPTDIELIKMLEKENEELREALDELRLDNDVLRGMLAEEQEKLEVLVGIVPNRQKIIVAREEELPPGAVLVSLPCSDYVMLVKERDVPPKPLQGPDVEFQLE
jgi:hypothetical protein